jgi:hypothetical protein
MTDVERLEQELINRYWLQRQRYFVVPLGFDVYDCAYGHTKPGPMTAMETRRAMGMSGVDAPFPKRLFGESDRSYQDRIIDMYRTGVVS